MFVPEAEAQTVVPFTQTQIDGWQQSLNQALVSLNTSGISQSAITTVQNQFHSLYNSMVANNFDVAWKQAAAQVPAQNYATTLENVLSTLESSLESQGITFNSTELKAVIQFVRYLSITVVTGPNGSETEESKWVPGSPTVQQNYLDNALQNYTAYGLTPYFSQAVSNFDSVAQDIMTGNPSPINNPEWCQLANLIAGALSVAIGFLIYIGCLPEPLFLVICPAMMIIAALLLIIAALLLIMCCC